MFAYLLLALAIPWTQQHLINPINYCNLATVCVHDNRPVCAATPEGCNRRSFLDQCDMYEFNCDFGTQFVLKPNDYHQPDCTACNSCR